MRMFVPSVLVLGFLLSFARGEDKEIKRKPKFTIGKETTYVTGPIDADGYIDYATALNERLGKGIKPAENANVLLCKAFGPHPEGTKMPPDFFKHLGIEAPPERSDYFIGLTRFMREHLKLGPRPGEREIAIERQLQERATKRAWTRTDYPEIAAWLKANEKPLALVIEATKRPHYFNPLVPKETKEWPKGIIWTPLPVVGQSHQLANALVARAMLHVAEGRPDAAWQDLIACHRLGRLIARGSLLVETLRGMAIDDRAGIADLAYLDGTKRTAKQFQVCLRDLQTLPPLPDVAETVDLGERCMVLDVVMMADRTGVLNLRQLDSLSVSTAPDTETWKLLRPIDWNPGLRNANLWYDRMAAAMRIKDREKREKHLAVLSNEHRERSLAIVDKDTWNRVRQSKDIAKARGKIMIEGLIYVMTNRLFKGSNCKDLAEQSQSNLHLAFALACYRHDHGRYPKTLDGLAPKYLARIPGDLFSGKSLIYRPAENGYLLYSVGFNGKDEEGSSQSEDGSDDIAVRMPLPTLPREE